MDAIQEPPSRWESLWRAALWCAVALAALLQIAQFASLPSFFENYALRPVQLEPDGTRGPVRFRVSAVDDSLLPGAAGLRVGDVLQRRLPAVRESRAGDVATFTLLAPDGLERQVALTYVPKPIAIDAVIHDIAWPIVQCLELLLGVIVLRARAAGRPALALATPLVLMGFPDMVASVLPIPSDSIGPHFVTLALSNVYPLGVPLFMFFAYEFARNQLTTRERALARNTAWLLFAASTAAFLVTWPFLLGIQEPLADPLYALSWVGMWLYTVGVLVTGMRRATGDLRERYLAVTVSTGFLLAVYVVWNISAWWLLLARGNYYSALVAVLLIFAGVVALAVSLLRHRVIEVRVVVSRTVVFSLVSAVLVLAFALVEFASDKFLHFHGRESSVLIDAGVALIVFLAARRLHHVVERFVERTLFRPWHVALNGLRDFARDAAFVTDADILRARLIGALARFVGTAAPARLFYRTDEGTYAEWRQGGGVASIVDQNEPWLVTMRATRQPIERSAQHPEVPDALAAPMLRTGHVTGFVLLGPKPNQQSYRSDELAAIDEVLGRVALDLESLRAISAEARLKELEAEVADLRANGLAVSPVLVRPRLVE